MTALQALPLEQATEGDSEEDSEVERANLFDADLHSGSSTENFEFI